MSIQLVSTATISLFDLAQLLTESYQGYYVPLRMTEEQLHHHVVHYNIDLERSRLALLDGQPVGLGFLGMREQRGWIGGLGVIAPQRRQGIARQIMFELLETAYRLGLSQIQLEAITLNAPAIALYEELGFTKQRTLHIIEGQPQGEWVAEVIEVEPQAALERYTDLHGVSNPWQRERVALERLTELSRAFALHHNGAIMAYVMGIFEQDALRFFDMGCLPNRPNHLRRVILHLHSLYPFAKGGVVNLPEEDAAWAVLFPLGYKPILSQYEMLLSF
jgi:GNAT superfamily N-acetyltransferase